jgi:hypothetical protein
MIMLSDEFAEMGAFSPQSLDGSIWTNVVDFDPQGRFVF